MPKKSCSLDPIPASLLFDCLDEIVPCITMIMNASLSSGSVPSLFKHALVNPLLKKSTLDPEILKNYRPVSNLPFLSKVLERIVLTQLMTHLENHNLLERFQSAYRKGHSTETALLRVVNDLLGAADRGRVSILSLLDLSAAFDTIDHDILCNRLKDVFGCTGVVLAWFRSYLTDRTQSVIVNNTASAPSPLRYGVPQGSVLGPVLFTMYTQPLSSLIKTLSHSYHFFADDSQLYDSAPPADVPTLVDDMSGSISSVADWMRDNKLKMNDDKTELIAVGTRSKLAQTPALCMTISDHSVSFSSSVRNLGVHLDESLSMEVQVNILCRALNFHLRRIGKIRQYLTVESANKLAVSFILSRLDFCNSLLAGLPDEKLSKLQRIQNNAARLVLRQPRRASATSALHTLHWLPVKARIEYKIACLCFHCLHSDSCPSYLSELLCPYKPSRTLRSQDASLLTVPRYSLNSFGKRSFSVLAPTLWNSLPASLRQIDSVFSFKKHLKTHLFCKYLDTV